MKFDKWFNGLPRLAQVILLLIPGVNWVIEVLVRWSAYFSKKNSLRLACALVVSIFGIIVGWVDLVWCILFKHLIFAK